MMRHTLQRSMTQLAKCVVIMSCVCVSPKFITREDTSCYLILQLLLAASIHSAATPLGSLLSGVLMDNCGRKLALQIAAIPVIIGWTMIAFSRSHIILLLGRLIAGISVGLTAAAGQVRTSSSPSHNIPATSIS